jgi:hypothetical protein
MRSGPFAAVLLATLALAGCSAEGRLAKDAERKIAAQTRDPAAVAFRKVTVFRQGEDYGVCGVYDTRSAAGAKVADVPFVVVSWGAEETVWAGPDRGQLKSPAASAGDMLPAWQACMAKGTGR